MGGRLPVLEVTATSDAKRCMLLARAKLRIAAALESRTLRTDACEAVCCAWLSLTTLLGLVLNAAFGWWWADPLAALAPMPWLAAEGLAGWRSECCGQEPARDWS